MLNKMKDDLYYKLGEYYDLYSSKNNYSKFAKVIKELLLETDSKKILDVGCGSGDILHKLGFQFELFGIDNSPVQIKNSKEKFPLINFKCVDFLDFNECKNFDALLFIWNTILYFCPESKLFETFKKANCLLKTGGVIIFDFSAFYDYYFEGKFKLNLMRVRKKKDLKMELVTQNIPQIRKRTYIEKTSSKILSNGKVVLENIHKPVELNLLSFRRVKNLLRSSGFGILEVLDKDSLTDGKKNKYSNSHNYLIVAKKL